MRASFLASLTHCYGLVVILDFLISFMQLVHLEYRF
jgi:hypothetical protein